jgi:hypothetical protein
MLGDAATTRTPGPPVTNIRNTLSPQWRSGSGSIRKPIVNLFSDVSYFDRCSSPRCSMLVHRRPCNGIYPVTESVVLPPHQGEHPCPTDHYAQPAKA